MHVFKLYVQVSYSTFYLFATWFFVVVPNETFDMNPDLYMEQNFIQIIFSVLNTSLFIPHLLKICTVIKGIDSIGMMTQFISYPLFLCWSNFKQLLITSGP